MIKAILSIIFLLILAAIEVGIGALCIERAIENFKDKRYFWFGMNIMVAIYCAATLINIAI